MFFDIASIRSRCPPDILHVFQHGHFAFFVPLCRTFFSSDNKQRSIFFTFSTRTNSDHFIDVNKMVINTLSYIFTSCLGFVNHFAEVLPKTIA